MNWFGGFWDAPTNDPVANAEAPVGIECGHRGEGVAMGETPHQYYFSRGAVPAVGFHGSRPPISDLRVGRHGAS